MTVEGSSDGKEKLERIWSVGHGTTHANNKVGRKCRMSKNRICSGAYEKRGTGGENKTRSLAQKLAMRRSPPGGAAR